MTQRAEPSQITFSAMRDLFAQKFPDRVEPLDQVKPELEAGRGAQALANLIGCEVEVRDEPGFSTYRWTGRSGPFELKLPKPFEPAPQRPSEPPQQAQLQSGEPGTLQEAPPAAAESAGTPEAHDDPPEVLVADADTKNLVDERQAAQPEVTPAEKPARGLFAALAALLGDSTLLMTVAKTGEADREPVLTVTVVPQAETESFTPVCLSGSVTELDAHFVTALESKADSRKRIEQAVADLKAADQALEDARKKEAEAKRKQTEAKKQAAAKLGEPAKTETAPREPPKPEPQEALF